MSQKKAHSEIRSRVLKPHFYQEWDDLLFVRISARSSFTVIWGYRAQIPRMQRLVFRFPFDHLLQDSRKSYGWAEGGEKSYKKGIAFGNVCPVRILVRTHWLSVKFPLRALDLPNPHPRVKKCGDTLGNLLAWPSIIWSLQSVEAIHPVTVRYIAMIRSCEVIKGFLTQSRR